MGTLGPRHAVYDSTNPADIAKVLAQGYRWAVVGATHNCIVSRHRDEAGARRSIGRTGARLLKLEPSAGACEASRN
jgi:hypothetical protein